MEEKILFTLNNSATHIVLYRNLLNILRGEDYLDTEKFQYAIKKSLFHNCSNFFYRRIMKEMEMIGFVRQATRQGYIIIRNKRNKQIMKNATKIGLIRDNYFPIALFR